MPSRPSRANDWLLKYRERRFGVLLVILIVLLAGPTVMLEFGLTGNWFEVLMSLLMLATLLSLCFERYQRWFALVVGLPALVLFVGGHTLSGRLGELTLLCGHTCEVLFFLGAASLIVNSMFSVRSISVDSLFGAVCGYIFLGLAWAVFYSTLASFRPGSFEMNWPADVSGASSHLMPHALTYYSFVTLTTVGYGDINPISPTARTSAWVEAMTGQFYLAVIVAGLVSMFVARSSTPRTE